MQLGCIFLPNVSYLSGRKRRPADQKLAKHLKHRNTRILSHAVTYSEHADKAGVSTKMFLPGCDILKQDPRLSGSMRGPRFVDAAQSITDFTVFQLVQRVVHS
jgi:hypothetical protein